ncbi:MAG: endonuclease III [Paludibacteraceae bacterium]|nr:endonuclease III [Paludibacteraceae bacterium]
MTQKERYNGVLKHFIDTNANDKPELIYRDEFSLLVAVILSAQCTDKRVNMVTPALIDAYPTAEAMAKASVEDVLSYVKSVSYPNAKARHLVGMAQGLVAKFGGVVPSTTEELVSLPGVGRKTANVITAVCFGQPTMAVDTHVFRVANRIGLTNNSKTPLETEKVLIKNIPEELVPRAHHWLILHGRYVCTARTPKCDECGIKMYCKYYSKKIG